MKTQSRFIILCLLFLLAITLISGKSSAQTDEWLLQEYYTKAEHVMYQDKSVAGYDTLCKAHEKSIPAGSVYTIGMLHTPDEVRAESPTGWPKGYYVEAALDIRPNGIFIPTKGLVERMSPMAYWAYVPMGNPPNINFSFYIPDDFAGHALDFHLCYEEPDSQHENQSIQWGFCVTAPHDKKDSACVATSYIMQAYDMGNFNRVIEIADSMFKLEQTDCYGWLLAILAAKNVHSYDKSITYLDKLWKDFSIMSSQMSGYSHGRPNPYAKQDSLRQQDYKERRNELLKLKAEWQKQQH